MEHLLPSVAEPLTRVPADSAMEEASAGTSTTVCTEWHLDVVPSSILTATDLMIGSLDRAASAWIGRVKVRTRLPCRATYIRVRLGKGRALLSTRRLPRSMSTRLRTCRAETSSADGGTNSVADPTSNSKHTTIERIAWARKSEKLAIPLT